MQKKLQWQTDLKEAYIIFKLNEKQYTIKGLRKKKD